MTVLRYGADSSVTLQVAAEVPLKSSDAPPGSPLADPAAAVAAALAQPLEYPALAQTATPGDRVVVALGPGLPQIAQITSAIVETLMAAGVDADGITILRSQAEFAESDDPLRLILPPTRERIRLASHDPASRRNMAYLAASGGGQPILLNRLLTDADVVLPVSCVQQEKCAGYFGIHTIIYPEFSDHPTQARFRKHDRFIGNGHHRELVQEVNNVAWLLGINFSVQIVPAAGDGILHVLAGQSDVVRRQSRELYRAAWERSIEYRVHLVVAAIEGSGRQTWDHFGRVLENAARLVEPDGAIAVCCDLETPPGPAMQRLVGADSREEAVRQIRRDNPRDALPALQLARVLQTHRVYLLSRLGEELVEDLEMIPVGGPDELVRLAQRSPSCLLLADAAQAMVRVENDA
jgi:nickel-dependent lactate racemase